jgi:hypothetical protein
MSIRTAFRSSSHNQKSREEEKGSSRTDVCELTVDKTEFDGVELM